MRRIKRPKRTPKTEDGGMAGKQGRPNNQVQQEILCVHWINRLWGFKSMK